MSTSSRAYSIAVGCEQASGQLGGDRRATESLALLQRAHQGLGEGQVVDEADPRQAFDLDADRVVVDAAVAQRALELALREAPTRQRSQGDPLRVRRREEVRLGGGVVVVVVVGERLVDVP